MKGKLILEDGSIFNGVLLFESETQVAEVVFNTSMSGYQEIFTDPSYAGQMVVMTYPLIGNYGIHKDQSESIKMPIRGVVINELYDGPIHPHAQIGLKEFLIKNNIPTITGIDCRALTRHIREKGALKGVITHKELPHDELNSYFNSFSMKTVSKDFSSTETQIANAQGKKHIALIDYGFKKSIKTQLEKCGVAVSVIPQSTSFEELQKLNVDGVILSNGPGNPEDVSESFELIKKIQNNYPTLGICLGHQVLCLVNGAKTYKMKFGNRGVNHSVIDHHTGKAFLSSQNHSYSVDPESLKNTDLEVRFTNVNDQTIEGVFHKSLPVFSVQFHPEAHSGPHDTHYLFEEFISSIKGANS